MKSAIALIPSSVIQLAPPLKSNYRDCNSAGKASHRDLNPISVILLILELKLSSRDSNLSCMAFDNMINP